MINLLLYTFLSWQLSQQAIRLDLGIIWIIFIAYWVLSVLYEVVTKRWKRPERMSRKWYGSGLLIAIVLILILLLGPPSIVAMRLIPGPNIVSIIGIALAAIGILFAIWARIALGSNWSGTVMVKKEHALVTTGPYSIVRHPIYFGIFLGAVGSFLGLGDVFTTIALIGIIIFCYMRIVAEEELMMETFGSQYKEYKKKVKMIVPFIY